MGDGSAVFAVWYEARILAPGNSGKERIPAAVRERAISATSAGFAKSVTSVIGSIRDISPSSTTAHV